MQIAEVGIGSVSSSICREHRWAVGMWVQQLAESRWDLWAFECWYMQRAEVSSGHVSAGSLREQR